MQSERPENLSFMCFRRSSLPSVNGEQRHPQVSVPESTGTLEATPMVQSCLLGKNPHSKPDLEGPRTGVDTNFIRHPR